MPMQVPTDAELAAMTPAAAFEAGFDYTLADWRAGLTPDQSYDLACTPANKRPRAFLDGAKSAGEVLNGWVDDPARRGKAYGITTAKVEELVARARAA